MVETRVVVEEGFEDIYDALVAKKNAIAEKYRLLAEAESEKIDLVIDTISHVEEVEVPEEAVEVENETAEGEEING